MGVQDTLSWGAGELFDENTGFSCAKCGEKTDEAGQCYCGASHNSEGGFIGYKRLLGDNIGARDVSASVVKQKSACHEVVESPINVGSLGEVIYNIDGKNIPSEVIVTVVKKISRSKLQVTIEGGYAEYRFMFDLEANTLGDYEIHEGTKRSNFQRRAWAKKLPSGDLISFLEEKLLQNLA